MYPVTFTRPWTDPTAAQDARGFPDIEVQVVGTPGTPYTPVRSLNASNYVACNAYDNTGAAVTSISVAGIYSLEGGAWLKFSAGAGSTLTIRGGA